MAPTSEEWKDELAYQRENIGRSVGMTSKGGGDYERNYEGFEGTMQKK